MPEPTLSQLPDRGNFLPKKNKIPKDTSGNKSNPMATASSKGLVRPVVNGSVFKALFLPAGSIYFVYVYGVKILIYF